jgi:hypothetical protein
MHDVILISKVYRFRSLARAYRCSGKVSPLQLLFDIVGVMVGPFLNKESPFEFWRNSGTLTSHPTHARLIAEKYTAEQTTSLLVKVT